MNKQIAILKELLGTKDYKRSYPDLTNRVLLFESENSLLIPPDLIEYFKLMDNAMHQLDRDLYQFYSFNQFKSIKLELALWGGVPDYRNLINTMYDYEKCFVFADYMSHLFAYAIRLYPNATDVNEVYLICGDKYKIIASSFSEFINLYFDDSEELKNI